MQRPYPVAPSGWAERARRHGPLPWSSLGPAPITGPEPVSEISTWLVTAADAWWSAAGRPDPWVLVVASADDGVLGSSIVEAGPECGSALRYVMVGAPSVRAEVPLEDPRFLFPAAGPNSEEDPSGPPPLPGTGPLLTALADLPALPGGQGAVVAVGTVGGLPVDRVRIGGGHWELRAAAGGGQAPEEVPVPVPDLPWPLPAGLPAGEYPVLVGAAEWLRRALGVGLDGPVAIVDRWTETTAAWEAGPPRDPVPLAMDQLARVRRPSDGPTAVAPGLAAVVWG